jgi:hypothetical protein
MAMDTTSGLPAEEVTVGQSGPAMPGQDPEVAEVDLQIERADLGPGCHTFVAAGSPIPRALIGLPR